MLFVKINYIRNYKYTQSFITQQSKQITLINRWSRVWSIQIIISRLSILSLYINNQNGPLYFIIKLRFTPMLAKSPRSLLAVSQTVPSCFYTSFYLQFLYTGHRPSPRLRGVLENLQKMSVNTSSPHSLTSFLVYFRRTD